MWKASRALALALWAGAAGADPLAECIAARDRACLEALWPEAVAAALVEEPRLALMDLTEAAERMGQMPALSGLVDAALAGPRPDADLIPDLLSARARSGDAEGLIRTAEALGVEREVADHLADAGYFAARRGDFETALGLPGPRSPDTILLAAAALAGEGRWDAAEALAAGAPPEVEALALHRIAWIAALAGETEVMVRLAGRIEALTRGSRAIERPGVFAQARAWLSGDVDELAATLEAASMPDLHEDPVWRGVNALVAAMIHASLGQVDTAAALEARGLAELETEIRRWSAEIDGELLALAAAAAVLGQDETAGRIMALRVAGGWTFENFHFETMPDPVARALLPEAVSQLAGLAEVARSGARRIDYADYALEEGLLTDAGPLCATALALGDAALAALIHADVERVLGEDTAPALWRLCHPPGTDPARWWATFGDTPEWGDWDLLRAALDQGAWDLAFEAATALHYLSAPDVVDLVWQSGSGEGQRDFIIRYTSWLAVEAAAARARYPDQADMILAEVVRARLVVDIRGAAEAAARIESDLGRAQALLGALWALEPGPLQAPGDGLGGGYLFGRVGFGPLAEDLGL